MVGDSSEVLCGVFEQDTLLSVLYLFNPENVLRRLETC